MVRTARLEQRRGGEKKCTFLTTTIFVTIWGMEMTSPNLIAEIFIVGFEGPRSFARKIG